jgi:hypothetical protein
MSRIAPVLPESQVLLRWGRLLARFGRGERVARLLARRLRLRHSPVRPILAVVSTHTTPAIVQHAATPPPSGVHHA